MSFMFTIAALFQLAVVLGIVTIFVRVAKGSRRNQFHSGEVDELREQVSLMRDFLRDAMDRIRRLEEGQEVPRLDPPPGRRTALEGRTGEVPAPEAPPTEGTGAEADPFASGSPGPE